MLEQETSMDENPTELATEEIVAEPGDEQSNGGGEVTATDAAEPSAVEEEVGDKSQPLWSNGVGSYDQGGVIYPYDNLDPANYGNDENYKKILLYGIHPTVATELVEMFNAGIFQSDSLEERTLEFVKNIQPEHGRFVLNQFRKSNLMGIVNPSAYLGSLIKNYKERVKLLGAEIAQATPVVFAPPKESLQALLDSKGYKLEVTIGQRKYGGPPPDFDGNMPGAGCEVYIGKLPKEIYEDEMVPLFEKFGDLYDFRVMMDPLSGTGKGYAFATYLRKEDAAKAAAKYDGFEIRPGKKLRCNVSIANTRLFVGNIPKSKSKEDILEEFQTNAEIEGIRDVIVYPHTDDPDRRKNRGFAFLEFNDHKSASTAKRRLASGRLRPFGNEVVVDWAEPQDDVDEQTMAQVKSVYVKNLREAITEEMVKEAFSPFGEIEKLKRIKDYCFVHYMNREDALKAIEEMNGKDIHGSRMDVSLARPQTDRKRPQMGRFQRGGPGFQGGMMMRGGYGGGMYGGPAAAMMDPYQAAYASGYGGPNPYDYGAYGAGGYGGGYDYAAASMGGYDYGYGSYGPPAPRGMPYGGPRPRGGMNPRGGPRGGGMYGSPGGAGMGYGRGGSPGFQRGGVAYGGFRGGMNKGGVPVKRSYPGGISNSPKRKNDGQQDCGASWLDASYYQNVPHDEVNWAQLAQQWIALRDVQQSPAYPPAPEHLAPPLPPPLPPSNIPLPPSSDSPKHAPAVPSYASNFQQQAAPFQQSFAQASSSTFSSYYGAVPQSFATTLPTQQTFTPPSDANDAFPDNFGRIDGQASFMTAESSQFSMYRRLAPGPGGLLPTPTYPPAFPPTLDPLAADRAVLGGASSGHLDPRDFGGLAPGPAGFLSSNADHTGLGGSPELTHQSDVDVSPVEFTGSKNLQQTVFTDMAPDRAGFGVSGPRPPLYGNTAPAGFGGSPRFSGRPLFPAGVGPRQSAPLRQPFIVNFDPKGRPLGPGDSFAAMYNEREEDEGDESIVAKGPDSTDNFYSPPAMPLNYGAWRPPPMGGGRFAMAPAPLFGHTHAYPPGTFFGHPAGYWPMDDGFLDAQQRKNLPAWIRDGLEKVEREKQKQQKEKDDREKLEKELQEKKKVKKKSRFESDSEEEEELEKQKESDIDGTDFAVSIEKNDENGAISSEDEELSLEDQKTALTNLMRMWLTDILMTVTSNELDRITAEIFHRAKASVSKKGSDQDSGDENDDVTGSPSFDRSRDAEVDDQRGAYGATLLSTAMESADDDGGDPFKRPMLPPTFTLGVSKKNPLTSAHIEETALVAPLKTSATFSEKSIGANDSALILKTHEGGKDKNAGDRTASDFQTKNIDHQRHSTVKLPDNVTSAKRHSKSTEESANSQSATSKATDGQSKSSHSSRRSSHRKGNNGTQSKSVDSRGKSRRSPSAGRQSKRGDRTERGRSRSPKRKKRSSRSPTKNRKSRSPHNRDRSPRTPSSSPVRRVVSPGHRLLIRSPKNRNSSPVRRSKSPVTRHRSRSPRFRSPKGKSPGPRDEDGKKSKKRERSRSKERRRKHRKDRGSRGPEEEKISSSRKEEKDRKF